MGSKRVADMTPEELERERERARRYREYKREYMRKYRAACRDRCREVDRAFRHRRYHDQKDPEWREAKLRRLRKYYCMHRGGLSERRKAWYRNMPEVKRKAKLAKQNAVSRVTELFNASVRLMSLTSPAAQA